MFTADTTFNGATVRNVVIMFANMGMGNWEIGIFSYSSIISEYSLYSMYTIVLRRLPGYKCAWIDQSIVL